MEMKQRNSISSLQKWTMYLVAGLFYFYDFILKLIPSIMMENIIHRLDITTNQFGIIEMSFYAIYTPMQLFCGPLLDEYGQKRVLPTVITICLLGSAISAVTTNYTVYIFARFLIGLGSAFAFVTVLKIASEWFSAKIYPLLTGLTTTFGMLGGIFSESVAPLFNQYDQAYFYGAILSFGFVLLIASLIFIKDRESHDDSPFNVWLIMSDVKKAMSYKQIWLAGVIGLSLFSPIQIFVPWAISFFSQDLQVSEIIGGTIASMLFWGTCLFSPLIGWVASKTQNPKRLLIIGNSLALVGMLMALYSAQNGFLTAVLLMFMVGVGVAAQPLVFVYASREVDLHLTATAVAITNFTINLSSLIQPYVGNQLVEVSKQVYSLESWRQALSIIPIILFVNYLFIYCLKEIHYENDD